MISLSPGIVLFMATGPFVVASLLMFWFKTGAAVHVAQLIQRVYAPEGFWPEGLRDGAVTRETLFDWANITRGALGELLTCPGCLSMHASYIVALAMLPVIWPCWPIALLGAFAWPSAANLILRQL